MRRAQAILVIFALASLPLILVAQTGNAPACNGMCCLRHSTHRPMVSEAMSCHHGPAGHMFECGMHSNQGNQNAMLAPLPPTMLSLSPILPEPATIHDARPADTAQIPSGFLPLPFEPPHS